MQDSSHSTNEQAVASRFKWFFPWEWPWGIWALVIGFSVMLVPFGIRAFMLAGVPATDEPFDIQEFCKWEVPADEDAFTFYDRAAALRTVIVEGYRSRSQTEPGNEDDVFRTPWRTLDEDLFQKGWGDMDEPLKQWCELHREALAVWKQGTEKRHGLQFHPDKANFETPLPTMQELRVFARLALLEHARCLHEGKMDEAWNWALAAYRSGGHCSYRGGIIAQLVAYAIHEMSINGMVRWAEQPTVSAEQLRSAMGDLKAADLLYERPSNNLIVEYLVLTNTFRDLNWLEAIDGSGSSHLKSNYLASVTKMGYWAMGEPELTIRVYRQMLVNQIPAFDKRLLPPHSKAGTGVLELFDLDPNMAVTAGQLQPAAIDRAVFRSILARHIMPATGAFERYMLRHRGREAVINALLAAQIYRRERGEFPESLILLTPDYLDATPFDPCDPAGGTLMYRRDHVDAAIIWSVAENRFDNGGALISSKNQRSSDVGYEIRFPSTHATIGEKTDN